MKYMTAQIRAPDFESNNKSSGFLRHKTYRHWMQKGLPITGNPQAYMPFKVKLIPDGLLPSIARFCFSLTKQR